MVGIIANKHPQQRSYKDPTSFVWGTRDTRVYEAGNQIRYKDHWNGFKANDVLLFSYDPQNAQLSVTRKKKTYTMNVQRDTDYYHQCNFNNTGIIVKYELL